MPGVREDRVHLVEDCTGHRMTLCPVANGDDVPDVLPVERGERVLFPFLALKVDPELAEDFPQERVVRIGKRMPFGSRGVPYLLDCGFDRLFLEELEPPPAQFLFTDAGHTCNQSELYCPDL